MQVTKCASEAKIMYLILSFLRNLSCFLGGNTQREPKRDMGSNRIRFNFHSIQGSRLMVISGVESF